MALPTGYRMSAKSSMKRTCAEFTILYILWKNIFILN